MIIALDAGPLGLITNPKPSGEVREALRWMKEMVRSNHRIIVPAIADYEVRRELIRSGKIKGIASLNAFNSAMEGRYIPLTDSALRLAATLWAQARSAGVPTADPKELDCDALIAAQILDLGLSPSKFIIATVNVGHLSLFAPADRWINIHP